MSEVSGLVFEDFVFCLSSFCFLSFWQHRQCAAGFSLFRHGLATCVGSSFFVVSGHGLATCVGFSFKFGHGLATCVGFSSMYTSAFSTSVARSVYRFLYGAPDCTFPELRFRLSSFLEAGEGEEVVRSLLPRAISLSVGLPTFRKRIDGSDDCATQEEPIPGSAVENPAVGRLSRNLTWPQTWPVLVEQGGAIWLVAAGQRW